MGPLGLTGSKLRFTRFLGFGVAELKPIVSTLKGVNGIVSKPYEQPYKSLITHPPNMLCQPYKAHHNPNRERY